jgi:protein TonB
VGGLVVSTVLHLIIITMAVRATGLTATPRPKTDSIPIVLAPLEKPVAPTPPPPRRQYAGDPSLPVAPREDQLIVTIDADIVPGIPELGAMAGLLEPHGFDPTRLSGDGTPTRSPNVSNGSPMLENQVEKAVIAIPGTATPRYPSMLQSAGLEGDVRAQFVVDTLGRVEQGSFRAVESTHALFAAAVRDALTQARFKPAEAGGHKVRQLVEQTFTFRITR